MTWQSFSDMPLALEAAGADPGRYATVLDRCSTFFSHYAALEEKLLGEVPVHFPAHLLDASTPDDPLNAGEAMARREQERLPDRDIAIDGMQAFLDREQLKVYRFEPDGGGDLLGFFLFDDRWGPAFAVNRLLPRGETDRVLARLYGHFLLDNDPYEIQLMWRREEAPDDSQVRASAFASVFLIPEDRLKDYLSAVGAEPGEATPALVEQLAVYFGVSPSLVALRFVSLGWTGPGGMEALLAGVDPENARWAAVDEAAFGDRYVRLALEAEAREMIDLKTLARYLETTEGEAALWKERFRL